MFITTDTQGRDMVSAYGPAHWHRPAAADGGGAAGEVQLPATPHIDRPAARGTLFDTCVAASPLSTPARSARYTGLPPNRNGAVCNDTAPSRAVPMLGELLAEAGYAANHVGKWHLDAAGYAGAGRADGGFANETWYDLSRFYDEVGRAGANRFGGWLRGLEDERFCFAHRVVDRAVGVLRCRDPAAPLFLAVELDEPHGPYICPPAFQGRYDQDRLPRPASFPACPGDKPRLQQDYAAWLAAARAAPDQYPAYYHKYYDCNSYADHEIGRLLDVVDHYCLNVLLIYTADHADHQHAAVRNELHDLLLAHMDETGDLLAGPGWARRPWRGPAAERPFEGYFTTGYHDRWPSGSSFTWSRA